MDDCDDIVKEFLTESRENLDRLDRGLVELEKQPGDRETLASIFRTIHTIKGTSGFLGFGKLEAVTHVGESLLTRLRDRQLNLNPERTTALLAMVDAVRQMLAGIESTGSEGERDDQELIASLTGLLQPGALDAASVNPAPGQPALPASAPVQPGMPIGEILVGSGLTAASAVSEAIEKQSRGDPRHVGEILVEQGAVQPQEVLQALQVQQRNSQETGQNTIRVNVGLLDKLMNLVGELVLARNQILQFTRSTEEANLIATGQRLNLIATELQESVMKTRMQPVGSVWSRFPRTVRDVALACGKRVRIEMEGQETELDKTLIEAIKDPMTHLVRNAVDHGIERAERRQAAGKSPEGLLKLRAYHEGGQVNIEISDDGAGLDLKKVVENAVQKGLIGADQAARLSDREAANLIFMPGLSTAEKVTNVSGRGVGMDVVRTNIERIGGTVDLQSVPGEGTTVKVKIPLTLAIIPALIVTSGGQRFAIPQVSLLELVGLEGEEARRRVEMIHGAPVYRLRGSLLPLVRLRDALRIGDGGDAPGQDRSQDAPGARPAGPRFERVNIVVLQADGQRFGLLVDGISDTEEIVVKPLSKHLKHASVYAGAAIMGDGKVALILDVVGVAHHARLVDQGRDHTAAAAEAKAASKGARASERRPLLLLQHGASGRMAIDLATVARLEEFPLEALEIAGDREAVQYRGRIMPILRLPEVLASRHAPLPAPEGSLRVVVVHAAQGGYVGLAVDRILDIVDESYELDRQTARHGVLGSAVIQRRVTDVVDVAGVIAAAQPALQSEANAS
jgi:two-component system, chemotaxis family, sensor kinase CheA